jgi:putative oxygen-independent coproporphyrinogen III oxidase
LTLARIETRAENTLTLIPHLYVHVPFCPTICPYCDFHVLERRAGLVEAYLTEFENDARVLSEQYGGTELSTLYVGGGTPSFLRDHELERLAGIIRKYFGWANQEATLEVNPGTVNVARAKLWRELGFTRASVGVQSTQDSVLKFLGRTHYAKQALNALETLLEAGFHVSSDAITAVPGQNVEQDLRTLGALGLEHISCYTLTIEEGTAFFRAGVKVRAEDEERSLELAESVLAEFGLMRYEVSNHAKPGFESKHNIAYWQNRFYFGLGAGAAGHYPNLESETQDVPLENQIIAYRRTNPHLSNWLTGERGEIEAVTRESFVTDALFSGLRLLSGVNLTDISTRAGINARDYFAPQFEKLVSQGLLEFEGETVRATTNGLWVLNQVISEFL